jgi:hypothetical protein
VIGINARDLSTFEIDRRAQLALVEQAPSDRVVIAESAIASRAQGAEAELAGADAILVGSTLMRASDPAVRLAELISRPLVQVCGLTRRRTSLRGRGVAPISPASSSPARRRAARPGAPGAGTMLPVAVHVGEVTDGADLVQLYSARTAIARETSACAAGAGREVVDRSWQGPT